MGYIIFGPSPSLRPTHMAQPWHLYRTERHKYLCIKGTRFLTVAAPYARPLRERVSFACCRAHIYDVVYKTRDWADGSKFGCV
jgi:hypothetical protein